MSSWKRARKTVADVEKWGRESAARKSETGQAMSVLVKRRLIFWVVGDARMDRCEFLWCDRRPLEVHLWFGGVPRAWVLSRDLLADGLLRPSGDGDVYIQPASATEVDICLSSPSGEATLRFAHDDLLDALDATWQVCERGSECIDFDAALASLLEGQS